LYPLRHRGEGSQAHLALIRSREALVSTRTQLVNHLRGALKSFGARLPKCPARSFHKRAAEHVPEALLPALGPILEQIGSLTERIRQYERQLEALAQRNDGPVLAAPKSAKSRRRIKLTGASVEVLKRHRAAQNTERLKLGGLWEDRGLVFPNCPGGFLSPYLLTDGPLKRPLERAG
jgi:hypothetical protein